MNNSLPNSIKLQDNSKWTSSCSVPEKTDKINLQIDLKTLGSLPPNDVSNAENNLRRVTRHHLPSAELKMHLVNIEEADGHPKKEDKVNIFTKKGTRRGDVDERSQTCPRSPT